MNVPGRTKKRPASFLALLALSALLLLPVTGCKTFEPKPLPPVDLSQPGWTVREGQAIYKRNRNTPEIAGDIIVATKGPDRAFVQFSKTPFPLVVAQSAPGRWQVETPTDNKRYSGRGQPPKRLIFLYLPRMLAGLPPPKNWTWQKKENNGWRLENHSNGEYLEGFFTQ